MTSFLSFGHQPMSKSLKIISDSEIEFEEPDLHEYLRRDIEAWIEANQHVHGERVSKEKLYLMLAEKLNISPRQLKRYMEGATEVSIKKALEISKIIGLKGIFTYANHLLGLDTCDMAEISVEDCDKYDAAEELIKNVKTFSEQAVALAESMSKKPTMATLKALREVSLGARSQMLKCLRVYEDMFYRKAKAELAKKNEERNLRIDRARKNLEKAGQERLF